ncbi:MAG TPA: DUF5985 family protein [Verrucomicrobiae bacterium]|nr:DUF5985 family protein [Verrucomicrobiae bacterium]
MISFLSGALTAAYFIAAAFFLRFWRRTYDRLFLHFCLAFCLFALNQGVVCFQAEPDSRAGYAYILRILGFVLILVAIVDKNTFRKQ